MKNITLKHTALLFMLIAALTTLTACNGNSGDSSNNSGSQTEAPIVLNPADICQELLNAGVFQDTLAEVDASYSEMLLGITAEEYVSTVIYMGSGATAERLVIFEAADSTAAEALKAKCTTHIADQTEAYAGYLPAEVDKLNNSILKTTDKYVILCVAQNYTTADELITKYFK